MSSIARRLQRTFGTRLYSTMSTTQSPSTMKAWQFQAPGPLSSSLKLQSVPRPSASSLSPDQVLVKTTAASINPADYKVQELGLVARAVTTFPKTAAMDFSGTVEAVGANVDRFGPGDLVVGRANPFKAGGALAQLVAVDAAALAAVPPGCDMVAAAGLPTAALTAYQSIAPHVTPGRGDRVLVNGASGGVGVFCVQVAKLFGCRVTATASRGPGEDLARSMGADEVIDYRAVDVVAHLKASGVVYDLIVDNVGNNPADLYASSRSYLGSGRPYVFVGGNVSPRGVLGMLVALVVPEALGGVRGRFQSIMTKDSRDDLETVVDAFAQGRLRVPVDSTFDFRDAKSAMEHVKGGRVKGKVIVTADHE